MDEEALCNILPPAPPAVPQPAVETPAPEPLTSEQVQHLDAAFVATKEEQAAAALMALWAASPLLVDRAGDHLGSKKRAEEEE
ncbi:MAG: hypothetical protein JNM56_22070 [Planctomycetia bacterium]|nr:hypothetical protein [Planctomycetia bacterium]